jgi:hypothetical protein
MQAAERGSLGARGGGGGLRFCVCDRRCTLLVSAARQPIQDLHFLDIRLWSRGAVKKRRRKRRAFAFALCYTQLPQQQNRK